MPEVAVKTIDNQDAGTLSLSEQLFGIEGAEGLMHEATVNFLANQRQGTHATKNRALITGGGRKPYRQKGSGRARAGTTRSPLWRGGATIFGPQPRDYSYAMPRKARRKALYAALSRKLADGEMVVVDELKFDEPKTKKMMGVLANLGLTEGSVLLVLPEMDANVALAARNIPAVNLRMAADLNAYEVLAHRTVLLTKGCVDALEKNEAGQ
jgi:large subunit ribosomal protein L4